MISTKGRYALRVMLDLAGQNEEKFTPLEEIAARQGISKKYLELILKALVGKNLLKGLRGKGGGYKLTRAPSEYNVGEILELAEGSLTIVACLQNENNSCERRNFCQTLPMWRAFDKMTRDFFSGITLQDLLRGENNFGEKNIS